MAGILGIGLRSIMAYQSAIQTTAQNLENAHTPFYSRRKIDFVESMFNNGVQVSNVRRVFDEISNKSLIKSTSGLGGAAKLYEGISEFEKLLDNDDNNVNKYIIDSLKSLKDLTTAVGSTQSRSAYLAQLSSLSNKIRSIGNDITNKKVENNQNITNTVGHINDIIKQIGSMNESISKMSADDKPTLLDQRNALVHELSRYVNINTETDDHDGLNVTLSNGLQIISNSNVNQFSLQLDTADSSKLRIMLGDNAGASDATTLIASGELSAMMKLRTDVLDVAERGLGRLALGLSSAMNAQNRLGIDLDGNLGGDIFSDINSADLKASRVISNSLNHGSGIFNVSIDNIGALTTSDYKLTFTDATHYTLSRINDNKVVTSGEITGYPATISAEGFTASIVSGNFSSGDSFTIKPTMNAVQQCNMTMINPSALALGFPVSAIRADANKGQGQINVDAILDTNNMSFSVKKQLNPPIRIEFLSDNTYQVVNASTNAIIEGPIAYSETSTSVFPTPGGYDPGYRITIKGAVKTGDQFSINYNTNVSGDTRNALKFESIYTAKIFANGSETLSETYNATSNYISLKTKTAQAEYDNALAVYDQAELRFAEISGVVETEELTNLFQYQQAYQASSEVIQIAKSLFDIIVNLSR